MKHDAPRGPEDRPIVWIPLTLLYAALCVGLYLFALYAWPLVYPKISSWF